MLDVVHAVQLPIIGGGVAFLPLFVGLAAFLFGGSHELAVSP